MKTIKISLILSIFFAAVLFQSCSKELSETDEPIIENKGGSNGGTSCLSSVSYINGTLSFASLADFESTYNCLLGEYQSYNTAQWATVSGMAEEDAIQQLYNNGYDDEMALIIFESDVPGYVSLRESLDPAMNTWLQSDSLFATESPYADIPVDKVLATLFNSEGELQIDGEIVSLSDNEARAVCDPNAEVIEEDLDCGRKMIGRLFHAGVGFSGFGFSLVGGTTATYKKVPVFGWFPAFFHNSLAAKKGNLRVKEQGEEGSCTEKVAITSAQSQFPFYAVVIQFYGIQTWNDPDQNHIKTTHKFPHCPALSLNLTN